VAWLATQCRCLSVSQSVSQLVVQTAKLSVQHQQLWRRRQRCWQTNLTNAIAISLTPNRPSDTARDHGDQRRRPPGNGTVISPAAVELTPPGSAMIPPCAGQRRGLYAVQRQTPWTKQLSCANSVDDARYPVSPCHLTTQPAIIIPSVCLAHKVWVSVTNLNNGQSRHVSQFIFGTKARTKYIDNDKSTCMQLVSFITKSWYLKFISGNCCKLIAKVIHTAWMYVDKPNEHEGSCRFDGCHFIQ